MKKLFILCTVLFFAAGCGENDNMNMKTLSCSRTDVNDLSGLTTKTKYDFKYDGDEIKHVTITYNHMQSNDNKRNIDGTNADTDGIDENTDVTTNDNSISSDEVVDGVVGDAIDETVDTVRDTILDIAGIKTNFERQFATYDNMEGFSYEVDTDEDNEYTVVYKIDMDKISDANLATFNIDRNFDTSRTNYESSGYTCE